MIKRFHWNTNWSTMSIHLRTNTNRNTKQTDAHPKTHTNTHTHTFPDPWKHIHSVSVIYNITQQCVIGNPSFVCHVELRWQMCSRSVMEAWQGAGNREQSQVNVTINHSTFTSPHSNSSSTPHPSALTVTTSITFLINSCYTSTARCLISISMSPILPILPVLQSPLSPYPILPFSTNLHSLRILSFLFNYSCLLTTIPVSLPRHTYQPCLSTPLLAGQMFISENDECDPDEAHICSPNTLQLGNQLANIQALWDLGSVWGDSIFDSSCALNKCKKLSKYWSENSDYLNHFNTSRMTTWLKEKKKHSSATANPFSTENQSTKIPQRLLARKSPIKVPFSRSPGCVAIGQRCFITSWGASQRRNTTLSRCCSRRGYRASSCTGGSGGAGCPGPTEGSPRTWNHTLLLFCAQQKLFYQALSSRWRCFFPWKSLGSLRSFKGLISRPQVWMWSAITKRCWSIHHTSRRTHPIVSLRHGKRVIFRRLVMDNHSHTWLEWYHPF